MRPHVGRFPRCVFAFVFVLIYVQFELGALVGSNTKRSDEESSTTVLTTAKRGCDATPKPGRAARLPPALPESTFKSRMTSQLCSECRLGKAMRLRSQVHSTSMQPPRRPRCGRRRGHAAAVAAAEKKKLKGFFCMVRVLV